MRTDFVLALTSLLGMTEALRRGCRHNPKNWGEGWYQTGNGDTLRVIAADFCVAPNVVQQWSGRYDNIDSVLPRGINLKLPCRNRRRDCRRNSANGDGAYVIVSNDNLDSIAADFCTTSDALVNMNTQRISNKDFILPGWVIQVPCSFNQ